MEHITTTRPNITDNKIEIEGYVDKQYEITKRFILEAIVYNVNIYIEYNIIDKDTIINLINRGINEAIH